LGAVRETGVMTGDHHTHSVHRRDVLCGGGAAAFATILATLLRGAEPLRAQPIAGAVPEVDRVAVRVVVDSYQIAVAPGMKVGNVDVQRFGWGIGAEPPRRTLLSEFGLSMLAESRSDAAARKRATFWWISASRRRRGSTTWRCSASSPRRSTPWSSATATTTISAGSWASCSSTAPR
jgi:hypothetical protein